MRSKNIFEVLLYSNVFIRYEEFYELLQTTIFAPIYDKMFLKLAVYICTLLERLFYSESNGAIFDFARQRNHKLWLYN